MLACAKLKNTLNSVTCLMPSVSIRGQQPLPKQSFRYTKGGGYTDANVRAWQECVAWQAKALCSEPGDGIYEVELVFYRYQKHRVDLDNLSKAVLDAMNGVVWVDDAQVHKLTIEKYYVDSIEDAGVDITVRVDPQEG